ncbi:MAG: TRAM domain-containing protein [Chlamydiia bacterium]|nr:TRAM domain-containing protein [Chlamydiia bacterium]
MTNQLITQVVFFVLCVALMTSYSLQIGVHPAPWVNLLVGLGAGLGLCWLIQMVGLVTRKIAPMTLATLVVGLIGGYYLNHILSHSLNEYLLSNFDTAEHPLVLLIQPVALLFCLYFGLSVAQFAIEQTQVARLFLTNTSASVRKLIVSKETLSDQRLFDLAQSGLVDERLIIPDFVMDALRQDMQNGDESVKANSRKALENVQKMEKMPELQMQLKTTQYPELKDAHSKLQRLAKETGSYILTASPDQDGNRCEGTRIVNINFLSYALKPVTQSGEIIELKIQRYGKEPRQGVGYLDDGTMVVVNSGANYIGETIKAQVLSVKHTASGRMIFCNAVEEEEEAPKAPLRANLERVKREFFSV